MNPYVRAALVGIGAAGAALLVGCSLLLVYVEWIWFSDHDQHYKSLTTLLMGAWIALPFLLGCMFARRFRAKFVVTWLVAAALLVPLAFVGVRVLSHNNLCFAGGAYPLDDTVIFGRECGR